MNVSPVMAFLVCYRLLPFIKAKLGRESVFVQTRPALPQARGAAFTPLQPDKPNRPNPRHTPGQRAFLKR
jgi:hypothetical protein